MLLLSTTDSPKTDEKVENLGKETEAI
jgi:hypothetical protein